MRIIGTYTFTVFGDGIKDELIVPLYKLKTPEPLIDDLTPTGIADARVGQSPGGVTATLDGEMLHLKFDIPPSSTKVTIEALFGTDY